MQLTAAALILSALGSLDALHTDAPIEHYQVNDPSTYQAKPILPYATIVPQTLPNYTGETFRKYMDERTKPEIEHNVEILAYPGVWSDRRRARSDVTIEIRDR